MLARLPLHRGHHWNTVLINRPTLSDTIDGTVAPDAYAQPLIRPVGSAEITWIGIRIPSIVCENATGAVDPAGEPPVPRWYERAPICSTPRCRGMRP